MQLISRLEQTHLSNPQQQQQQISLGLLTQLGRKWHATGKILYFGFQDHTQKVNRIVID